MTSADVTDDPTEDLQRAQTFQCDLYDVWRAVHLAGGLPIRPGAVLSRSQLAYVYRHAQFATHADGASPHMAAQSRARVTFMCWLLQRLELLTAVPGTPPTAPMLLSAATPTRMERFLAQPLADRLRQCLQTWMSGESSPDQPVTQQHTGKSRSLPPGSPVGALRQRLVRQLAELPAGGVVPLPSAELARSRSRQPPRPSPANKTHQARLPRPRLTSSRDAMTWEALGGPLQWLGIVRWHDDPDRDQSATPICRLTTVGAALLHSPSTETLALEESHGKVVVQPNLDIIAYPPIAPLTLLVLDACAERVGSGRVARYHLTRDAFAASRRAGWRSGAGADWLSRLAADPLPQNVLVTLADWDRAADRLTLARDMVVLETPVPGLLDAMAADPRSRGWLIRRISPTIAFIEPNYVDEVRQWLLRHGELPAVISASRQTRLPLDQA